MEGCNFVLRHLLTLCAEWRIDHESSSPYNHRSNGAAEAAVKTVKHLLLKCSRNGNLDCDTFREGLLELRNTPHVGEKSPAELLYGRNLRSKVLAHPSKYMLQSSANPENTSNAVSSGSEVVRPGKDFPLLTIGQYVRVQDALSKRWRDVARVLSVCKRKRSYILEKSNGSTFWRNRRFLRPYIGPRPFWQFLWFSYWFFFQLRAMLLRSRVTYSPRGHVVSRISPSQPAPVYHTQNLHLSITLTTCTWLHSHSQPAPVYLHTQSL